MNITGWIPIVGLITLLLGITAYGLKSKLAFPTTFVGAGPLVMARSAKVVAEGVSGMIISALGIFLLLVTVGVVNRVNLKGLPLQIMLLVGSIGIELIAIGMIYESFLN